MKIFFYCFFVKKYLLKINTNDYDYLIYVKQFLQHIDMDTLMIVDDVVMNSFHFLLISSLNDVSKNLFPIFVKIVRIFPEIAPVKVLFYNRDDFKIYIIFN